MDTQEQQQSVNLSDMEKRLLARVDVELLTIRLSDFDSNKVPAKLYEYAFKKYLKDQPSAIPANTPQELAMYLLMKKLDAAETVPAPAE